MNRPDLIKISKKLYHLWKCNLLIFAPGYEAIVLDIFDYMAKGPLSDKQLQVLAKAYDHDRAVRADTKALKLATIRSLPAAWARARKRKR